MVKREITVEKAIVRLETLCARSERCRWELAVKLKTWGIGQIEAEKILDDLEDKRFFSDERYANAYVNDKYRFAGHGRLRIAIALSSKRIDRGIINAALDAIDEELYEGTLNRLMASRAGRYDLLTFEGRTKLYRFGMSRGYESSIVGKIVKNLAKESRDGAD